MEPLINANGEHRCIQETLGAVSKSIARSVGIYVEQTICIALPIAILVYAYLPQSKRFEGMSPHLEVILLPSIAYSTVFDNSLPFRQPTWLQMINSFLAVGNSLEIVFYLFKRSTKRSAAKFCMATLAVALVAATINVIINVMVNYTTPPANQSTILHSVLLYINDVRDATRPTRQTDISQAVVLVLCDIAIHTAEGVCYGWFAGRLFRLISGDTAGVASIVSLLVALVAALINRRVNGDDYFRILNSSNVRPAIAFGSFHLCERALSSLFPCALVGWNSGVIRGRALIVFLIVSIATFCASAYAMVYATDDVRSRLNTQKLPAIENSTNV
ncbi:hypothetical protein SKDZ_09G1340 [Saccharomyces kudriavzevii ZP591]|nr:hypothetical protein SKDZ_09G1340 [Saccharomyces kudriavzevii ZP591]